MDTIIKLYVWQTVTSKMANSFNQRITKYCLRFESTGFFVWGVSEKIVQPYYCVNYQVCAIQTSDWQHEQPPTPSVYKVTEPDHQTSFVSFTISLAKILTNIHLSLFLSHLYGLPSKWSSPFSRNPQGVACFLLSVIAACQVGCVLSHSIKPVNISPRSPTQAKCLQGDLLSV